jgi:hypothetical protein
MDGRIKGQRTGEVRADFIHFILFIPAMAVCAHWFYYYYYFFFFYQLIGGSVFYLRQFMFS